MRTLPVSYSKSMKMKINIDLNVGRVVRYFVLIDFIFLMGWGFLEPVFSVFIIERIAGATLATVGISAGIYWAARSLLQLPIAQYLDRNRNEKRSARVLLAGFLTAAFCSLLLLFVDRTWELYAIQFLHAAAFALYFPSWSGIFSNHLDRARISFDWTLDNTAIGLSTAFSALLGGFLASAMGFEALFMLTAACSLAAAFMLFFNPSIILPSKAVAPLKERMTIPLG